MNDGPTQPDEVDTMWQGMSYGKRAQMTSIVVWALGKFFFVRFLFLQLTNCISLFFRIYTTANDGYWCMTPNLTMTAPPTTAMSHCLWGGKGCYMKGTGGWGVVVFPFLFLNQ
jgi:hypothetical protein